MGVDAWLERVKLWHVIAALTVGLGLAIGLVVTLGGSVASSAYSDREAIAQCEGFADKRLKAPSTAEYDLAASESEGSWTVVGTVDSQNSFGAMIRNDVACVLHFTDDTAVLDSITID